MHGRPRKEIDMDTVKHLYIDKNLSTRDVAKHVGVSYQTINRRLREYGLPLKRWSVPDRSA